MKRIIRNLHRMKVHWEGGEGERIPAWAQRVVQDAQTPSFTNWADMVMVPWHSQPSTFSFRLSIKC